MSFVITSICDGVCAAACVQVCPVDCIQGPYAADLVPRVGGGAPPGVRMFIDADACTSCGACEAVCPVQAIVPEDDLPYAERGSIDAAERFFRGARGGAA